MSLIVEEGTGKVDAESYASVAAANAYFAATLNAESWDSANDPTKEKALKMATRTLDATMTWNGFQTTTAQALGWPRQRARNPDAYVFTAGLGSALSGYYYNANQIPADLIKATCQCAFDLLINAARVQDAEEMGVSSIDLGGALKIDFDKTDRIAPVSDQVTLYLKKLGMSRAGGAGMVRVRRG